MIPFFSSLHVVLLHENMYDKQGAIVTTSLTLIDIHDMARSSKTYGISTLFVAHPSQALRKLALTLERHWTEGFGATYNPNRKEALAGVKIVTGLDEAVAKLTETEGKSPFLIATSAHHGEGRVSYQDVREKIQFSTESSGEIEGVPGLLMFGTGWGMSEVVLNRAQAILEPIDGPTEYNHLSVRSACAVILDRLLGKM